MKNYLRFLSPVLLLIMAVMFGGGKILAQNSEKFDFVGWKFTTEAWTTDYLERSVSGNVVDVVFSSANKQNQTITDCPVTKGKPITVSLKDPNKYNITGVKLLLKKWGKKTQTVTLNVSADGKTFTSTSKKSSKFELNASSLTTKALKFTFSNNSNQVGVQSIEIFYEKGKTETTLSFPTSSYTYELGQDNGTVIIGNNAAVLKDKEGNVISDASGKITYSVESSVKDLAILGSNENSSDIIVDTNKAGTATVTATFAGDDTYAASKASYTINVKEVITPETLTTSAGGYATYSADYAVNYSELGLTAYTLTVDESKNTVTAKEFTGVVPAGGAVLVKGDASKAYTLTPATTEGDATFTTDLKTGATKADGTQYGFTSKSGTPAFAQVKSGQEIPAKKGYIVLNSSSAAKYAINFDGEATGIHTIEAASAANAAMYNLAGQRVDKAYKGIVIVNGKKYLNK